MQSSTLRSIGCALVVFVLLLVKFEPAHACPIKGDPIDVARVMHAVETANTEQAARETLATPAPGESGTTPPVMIAAFMLLMLGFPLVVGLMHRSRDRKRQEKHERVSILLAEDALHILLRGHRVGAIVTGILTAGLVALIREVPLKADALVDSMFFVLPGGAFVVFLGQLVFDHAALRYLARDGASAQRRGPTLVIGGTNGDLRIRLSASIFESARGASVPAASAGLRRDN